VVEIGCTHAQEKTLREVLDDIGIPLKPADD
jgi:hypothetical protein